MKKILLILFIITLVFSMSSFAENIDYKIIKYGEWFQRGAGDNTYSAIIYNTEGFNEFIKDYPVDIKLDEDFFKDNILIVGFSDNSWSVTADGFKRKGQGSSPYFYMDLYDLGTEVKAQPVEDGKKYTSYCAAGISNDLVLAHVQVREGIQGLSKQYGREN